MFIFKNAFKDNKLNNYNESGAYSMKEVEAPEKKNPFHMFELNILIPLFIINIEFSKLASLIMLKFVVQ